MKSIVVLDHDGGRCWQLLRLQESSRLQIRRAENWEAVNRLWRSLPCGILVCSAEHALCRPDLIDDFQRHNQARTIAGQKPSLPLPVLLVGTNTSDLQHLFTTVESGIELIGLDAGPDYLFYRLDYLSELLRVAEQQGKSFTALEHQNQALLNSAAEGIIHYDLTGAIIFANPRAEQILKFEKGQLLKHCVFDLLASAAQDAALAEDRITELTASLLRHEPFHCDDALLKTGQGSTIVVELSVTSLRNGDGNADGHLLLFQDITSRTINEQRLIKLAEYDALTGLANRSKFHNFTDGKITHCARSKKQLALLFIDVDHFKNINDSMGHDAGDELLVAVAERLRNSVRESDMVARIGGDEFAITLQEVGNPNQVTRIARHILDALSRPFFIRSREISVSVSIGISLFPGSGDDLRSLTQTADTAMYQAKLDGRNTYRFYSEEIQNRVMEQTSLEEALRKAIKEDEFFLNYQAQVDTISGRIVGLEALIRWQHQDWPNMGPHRFIPVAEESGLISAIGRWVLYTACRQAEQWRQDPEIAFDFPISVNLSPKQLVNDDFISLLHSALNDTGLPPANLILELTETAVMQNPDVAITTLGRIKSEGVQLAVDDFGTGYSSLNYLKKLPISKLKIDRTFVRDIGVDANGEAIVKAILALAHSLSLEVVAEGVEEQSHVDFLRGHACETLQGYFFSKPLSTAETVELLRAERIKWPDLHSAAKRERADSNKPDSSLH